MASIYARRLMEEDKNNKLGQAGLNGENSVVYTGQPMSDTNYNTGANRGSAPLATAMNTIAGQAMGAAQKALTEPKATGQTTPQGAAQPASTLPTSTLPTSNDKTMGTVSRLLSAAGGNMQDAPVIATIYNPSMSAPKKVVLENSVMGGSGFKAADGDAGKLHLMKDGSSYVVDENGVMHWYDPSPSDGSLHGAFKNSNGYIYSYDEATDDELMSHGFVRGADGLISIASDVDRLRYAVQSGQMTPAQATAQYASRQGTYGPGGGGAPTSGNPGGNAYQQYLSDYDSNYSYKGGSYGTGEPTDYKARRDAALAKAEGMDWSYDPYSDPVWQAYQKQYRREGDRATREAMAQAASMTGGIPSSYAATAASQAGDYYASQLSDKIPQLYQDAYNRYLSEFQKQLQISDQYQGFDDREYERDYQARRDAINDARYDQEWAQKLREYADAQGWKATEWEQYLREYGDQLSEQERQWAYTMARDAEDDRRYNQEWEYQKTRDAVSDQRYADQTAYQKELDALDRQYQQDTFNYKKEQDAIDNQYRQDTLEYEKDQAALDNQFQREKYEYGKEQDALDRDYNNTAYQDKLRQYDEQQYYDVMNAFSALGVADDRIASYLGIPKGMSFDAYRNYYGGVGYGSDTVYNNGGQPSGTQTGTPTGNPAGTPTGTPKTPEKTNPITEETPKETNPQTSYKIIPGVYHDGTKQPMTEGFRDNWPMIRDAFDQGATESEITRAIDTLVKQGKIADYEKDVILRKLGLKSGLNTTWRSR